MSTLPPRPRVEFFTGIHTGDHFRVGVRCWGSMPDDLRFALVDSRGNAVAHEEKVTGKVTATRTREQAKQKKVSVPRKGDGSTVYFPRFMPRDDWANEPLRLVLYKSTNQEHLCELKLGRIARKTHSTTQATTEVLIEKLREIADLTEEERDRLSVHHWMLVTARSFLLYKLLTNDTAHKRSIRAEEDEVLAAELRKPPERFGAWLDYLIKVGDKKAWENGYLLLITDEKVEAQRLLPRPGDFLLRPSYRFANERVIMVNVGGVLKKHRVRNRGPVPVLTLGDPCERMLVFAEGSYQTIPLNQVSPDVLAISSFSPYPDDTPQEGQGDRVHPLPPSPAAPVAPTPTPPTPTPIPALLPRAAPLPFWASLEWVADELEVGNVQEGQVEHLLYNEEPPLAAPVPAPRVAELEVGNAQEGQVEHLLYNEEPPLAAPAPAPRVAAAAIRPFSTLEAGVVQAGGWRFGPTKKRKLEPTPDVAAYEWHQGAYEDLDCGGTIDLQPPVGFPCAILPQDAQSVVVASPMDVSDHHTLQQLFPPKQQMVQMHGLNGLDGGDQGDRDLLLYEDNPPARFDFPARPIGA